MTEKTPISPTEIREGDTIRWEGIDERRGTRLAIEYIAHHDGDDRSWADDGGEYYLLKRFERPAALVMNPPRSDARIRIADARAYIAKTLDNVDGGDFTWENEEVVQVLNLVLDMLDGSTGR